jgi:hypothetical protein
MIKATKYSVVVLIAAAGLCIASIAGAEGMMPMATSSESMMGTMMKSHAMVNQPMLTISAGGKFLARGMTVASVSGTSFQGQIWGITYTVNASPDAFRFFARTGNGTSTPMSLAQLAAGDEVAVQGWVTTSSPMIVTANVVRNNSIMTMMSRPQKNEGEGMGMSGMMMNGTTSMSGSSGNSDEINQHISDLFKQLQEVQDKMKSMRASSTMTSGN